MENNFKFWRRFFSYLAVAAILFFLFRQFLVSWPKITDFDLSFNYFYLIFSFLLLDMSIFGLALVWNYILRSLDPQNKLSNLAALKIYIYSEFAKYLPGALWPIVGKVYIGAREGISKKNLAISSFLDSFLPFLISILIGMVLAPIELIGSAWVYYILIISVLIIFLAFFPKFFWSFINWGLKLVGRAKIADSHSLSRKKTFIVLFVYFIINLIGGLAFFFFINSVVKLPAEKIFSVVGIYNLAIAMGVAAVFAPSGLGVREGAMSLLLSFYLPSGVAILISFVARLWFSLAEILLLLLAFLINRFQFKKIILNASNESIANELKK
ncbi:MAG: hypothetical protein A2174_02295 [Candidatus Portnoybacteria bacterium RBG_13_41_18]|uniref:TIGR00374 family protein n=1 Tax=Candidatus Portnoybacteria bacterium RBG_13_41_18 TaxID=1801991 RepID=A0A1G2F9S3_9BACT|nr:MAG: hypothetical protein A2174_02295 [Candidatus Portnoybacteria bacterium RBG_13_41_18]